MYFNGPESYDDKEREMLLELIEKVQGGDVPTIIKEWVDKWKTYWKEHWDTSAQCRNSRNNHCIFHVIDTDWRVKRNAWEKVKLNVVLFGVDILENRVLHVAANDLNTDIVKYLLEVRAWDEEDLHPAAFFTITPTHNSGVVEREERQVAIIRMLLANGLDPNLMMKGGGTSWTTRYAG